VLPSLGFETFPNGGEQAQTWQAGWTLFYWGWWISWAPFVGMFLARISYGRTIRQFVAGAFFAPVGASMVWLTVFGDSALSILLDDPDNALSGAATENAMFELIDQLPVAEFVATLASILVILVVVIFFATSSDSGSLVVDILTNGGDPHPKWQQRMFWAILEGVIAAVLLVAGSTVGDDSLEALSALQTAAIVAGLPFCIVLILFMVALVKALREERIETPGIEEPSPLVGMREYARMTAPPRETAGDAHMEVPGRHDEEQETPAGPPG
jgi:choline/glycine/proline betaine transport protein